MRCTPHILSGWRACSPPARLLIAPSPRLLLIAQSLLDFIYCRFVSCVLANVVANLDGVTPRSRGDLDNNVEGHRLVACCLLDEIICHGQPCLEAFPLAHLLVRKVPTPKVGWNPAASAAALYLKHSSRFKESENTMVFLSLMPSWS